MQPQSLSSALVHVPRQPPAFLEKAPVTDTPLQNSIEEPDTPPSSSRFSCCCILDNIPVEAAGFFCLAAIARIAFQSLVAPLMGIGVGILGTKLVLKAFDSYDSRPLVHLTKEACKINKKYPKLQLISLIFALSIGFLSPPLSFIAGSILGIFGAIILDVESYKLIQEANRKERTI